MLSEYKCERLDSSQFMEFWPQRERATFGPSFGTGIDPAFSELCCRDLEFRPKVRVLLNKCLRYVRMCRCYIRISGSCP